MNKLKYFIFTVIILVFLYFVYFVTYTFVEPKAYDFMTRHVLTEKLPFDNNKQVYGHDDIVLIVIDSKTVETYRWPWKRELNCKIFEYFLNYAKPKAVVHDSVITTLDTEDPESDKKLFNTLKKFDNLIEGFLPLPNRWKNPEKGEMYDKEFEEKFRLKNIEYNGSLELKLFESFMTFPKPYFDTISKVGSVSNCFGFIDGNLSDYASDDIMRYTSYFIKYNNVLYPSLAMQTFMYINNYPKTIVDDNYIYFPALNFKISQNTTIWQMFTPLKFYKLYDYDSPYNGYSHIKYSAVDIMDSYDNLMHGKKPVINPELFKDKIVVIGANVTAGEGLNDVLNSSVTTRHPGVDIQATSIDNLLHKDFLKILPKWFNIFVILAGMFAVYYIIKKQELFKALSYALAIPLLYLIICTALFYYGIVIYVITPVVMFIVTMIIGYVHRYIIENKNKLKVENAMGKYMSEDVMKRVIQNIDNLGLGGKKANVTVLFSDIRGFTSMSEKMSAGEVSALLNEYFSEMEPIVTKYNGIINKFIGDAIMAVFGEPIQDENHPLNAVKCGCEMLKKVQDLHKKWEKEGKPLIEIGIGINTGEVFVGNIGSEKRMEYTVIGDTVNLASRLESYNKTYKTKILISSSTYEYSKANIEVNEISDVEIRGKAQKMNIYEVKSLIE